MANIAPATVNITAATGPGLTPVAQSFTDVTEFGIDFPKNVVRIVHGGVITYYDYSAMTTFTWVITAGRAVLTIS